LIQLAWVFTGAGGLLLGVLTARRGWKAWESGLLALSIGLIAFGVGLAVKGLK